MTKKLDLNHSVYELVMQYPELTEIMNELGFSEITKSAMLYSVGKITTIPKGAKRKGIPMTEVIAALMRHGFEITGTMPPDAMSGSAPQPAAKAASGSSLHSAAKQVPQTSGDDPDRKALLKSYLSRLGSGEDLEAVRADFKSSFRDVDAAEIMEAEQEMMAEGTPLTEVQRLCDLHSALFHGATKEEQILQAEEAVAASLRARQNPKDPAESDQIRPEAAAAAPAPAAGKGDYTDREGQAKALEQIPGHPLETFSRENRALQSLLAQAEKADRSELSSMLPKIRELAVHYAKKGDLLYPLLKVNYDISGPSDVMWTVDDEIRDELAELTRDAASPSDLWEERVRAALTRAEEMIYKEENILFPICAVNFQEEEWLQIYEDAKDYAPCLSVEPGTWTKAEQSRPAAGGNAAGCASSGNASSGMGLDLSKAEVVMPGGHMSVEQITAMLNTIPMEITFIDDQNINRYFNESEGPKAFKRPKAALDREVFSCHPPKIEPLVRSIIDDFRSGARDSVPVWMEKNGHAFLVKYMAVRDSRGRYLGTMELVQDMEFAKEHFTK